MEIDELFGILCMYLHLLVLYAEKKERGDGFVKKKKEKKQKRKKKKRLLNRRLGWWRSVRHC